MTGARSGIGRAAALLFAREGGKVVLVHVKDKQGEPLAAEINASDFKALYLHADVSKAADCQNMIAAAEKKFGGLHVLFNNAGIMHAADGDAISTDEAI